MQQVGFAFDFFIYLFAAIVRSSSSLASFPGSSTDSQVHLQFFDQLRVPGAPIAAFQFMYRASSAQAFSFLLSLLLAPLLTMCPTPTDFSSFWNQVSATSSSQDGTDLSLGVSRAPWLTFASPALLPPTLPRLGASLCSVRPELRIASPSLERFKRDQSS